MRIITAILIFGAATLISSAHAQSWVIFVPPERDFRVLFPDQPTRSTASDGSIVYTAQYESGDDSLRYVVYHLPPTVRRIDNVEHELRQRVQARIGEDVALRSVHEEDAGPAWERHVFRYHRTVSIHRLVGVPGRYYELEVVLPRGRSGVAVQTARDFFNSFQGSGFSIAGLGAAVGQRIEAWCQNRTDPFTRAFCEYSVCLQAGAENYPHCKALFRR